MIVIVNENTWKLLTERQYYCATQRNCRLTDASAALNTYVGDHFVNWYLINR